YWRFVPSNSLFLLNWLTPLQGAKKSFSALPHATHRQESNEQATAISAPRLRIGHQQEAGLVPREPVGLPRHRAPLHHPGVVRGQADRAGAKADLARPDGGSSLANLSGKR